MIQLLLDNPLLLLFVVVAIGYPIGRIKIGGSSLGVAAVLFSGLAVGALHPQLQLPEILYNLGLVVFVYTIGLTSGAGFFASFRRKGLRDNLLILAALGGALLLTALLAAALRLSPTLAAGMFAGALTNTPALAAVLEAVRAQAPAAALDRLLNEPVVAYSITYPMGVVSMILTVAVLQRRWKVDYAREAEALRDIGAGTHRLSNRTLRVTRNDLTGTTLGQLKEAEHWDVVFGRIKREGRLELATGDRPLHPGDLLTVVGTSEELDRVTAYLGEPSSEPLDFDRSQLDYRRIFVSNSQVAGHRLSELNLPQQYGAVITRIRRGDVELVPHGDTVLELGDRVRVLTRRSNLDAVSRFFGDSYRALSEIDILSFSLGLALGMLLGIVPIPLPGGVTLRLGLAGGPLIVALILGWRERTGPLVWALPYSANLTLRQVGLILFLAGVGTRAGYAFFSTLVSGEGLAIFFSGILITTLAAVGTLYFGHRLLRIPMGLLTGMLAGLQTQPAVLGFALEQSDNDLPNIGYASVYPVATIAKILFAQLLLAIL